MPGPTYLEKVVANIAIEEIATVLREVSSTQPQHSETPELSASANAPAGDGPLLLTYAGSVVPSVRPSPPVTSLPTSGLAWSGTMAQCCIATSSPGSGVLWALSPILDLKGPLSTLPWCEQVDRKEQEAVASATTPAAITSDLSTASQGATQPPAETANLRPALRDLDVVQAVQSVSPGQERHLVAMFLLTFPTDLG